MSVYINVAIDDGPPGEIMSKTEDNNMILLGNSDLFGIFLTCIGASSHRTFSQY